jgi:VWFA-related protein
MHIHARLGCLALLTLFCATAVSAQKGSPQTLPPTGAIHLDVVVTSKGGRPVSGLRKEDFTVLDNKAQRPISSFEAITGRDAPIEVILVIDGLNADYQTIGVESTQVDKFLRAEGGHLAYPVALVLFTEKGLRLVHTFSTDGNELCAAADRNDIGVRSITRNMGAFGGEERVDVSLRAMGQLLVGQVPRPGRKVVLWISPGWPLLSGTGDNLLWRQQQQTFAEIVWLSTQFLRSRVTLYSVDPLGNSANLIHNSYWRSFVKGVSKPDQVAVGDLALQVLATQSGGLVFDSTNDIAGALQQCLAESSPFYEISFDPPRAAKRDEYHHLEIKLAKPGLAAHTRQGYYEQP